MRKASSVQYVWAHSIKCQQQMGRETKVWCGNAFCCKWQAIICRLLTHPPFVQHANEERMKAKISLSLNTHAATHAIYLIVCEEVNWCEIAHCTTQSSYYHYYYYLCFIFYVPILSYCRHCHQVIKLPFPATLASFALWTNLLRFYCCVPQSQCALHSNYLMRTESRKCDRADSSQVN